MVETISLSVAKKLHAVMSEVDYIKKDKKNDFHRYNYASEQAIKETLHPLLVKHGLLFLPIGCDVLSDIETVNSKGNKERLMTIRYAYRFVDVETGEFVDGYSLGTGVDSSDKSVYKGITGAIKYILTGTFLIPTGDDPEHEEKRGSAEKQKAVADRKLNRTADELPPPPPPPPMDEPPPMRSAGPQAVTPTTKNGEFLAQTQKFKEALGEPLYRRVITGSGYKKSNEAVSAPQQATLLKRLAAAQKIANVAANGEMTALLTEEIFNLLPQTSIVAITKEFQIKLASLIGTESAREEFEHLRSKSKSLWEFCCALRQAYEHYAKQAS